MTSPEANFLTMSFQGSELYPWQPSAFKANQHSFLALNSEATNQGLVVRDNRMRVCLQKMLG